MKPYYDGDGITIYHGDCREILPYLPKVDLVLTDPPYGIGADRNLRANKQHGKAAAPSRDYGVGNWDASPPDRELLELVISRGYRAILWGGNYFLLPPASCWLVWDKDNGDNRYADCELAWTNLDSAVRKYRHRWMGMLQENMSAKEERVHPTQKPVPLMMWCLRQAGEAGLDGDGLIDPFMGAGSTLVAAKRFGLRAIGIEIEERYCEIAAKRLENDMPLFSSPEYVQGELFAA